MIDNSTNAAIEDAVEWALSHGVALKNSPYSSSHTAFSLTPTLVSRDRFENLKSKVSLLGKLIHNASEDHTFLHNAIEPITSGDPFFQALLAMHREIHPSFGKAARLPLLIMRNDFMDDQELGPKLIEFNGIAAGMGPFGQRAHELHSYLKAQWPSVYAQWSSQSHGELVANPAIERLAKGIAKATIKVKQEFNDPDPPRFIMVVQEQEDNVYDQRLLEYALQKEGIQTLRKTFRELHGALSTGPGQRLILDDVGTIDSIYLRAGYQYQDYYAADLDSQMCCEALIQTRVLVESHRVAINATVSQQLATSKRVQMLFSSSDASALTRFGLTLEEAQQVKELLGDMLPVTRDSASWIKQRPSTEWVLKNQGEGGGHCVFGDDIHSKLDKLNPEDYDAWSLMRRLHPSPRKTPALLIRKGKASQVDDLISEIGLFTIHIDGEPAVAENGYAGYLIRSKPSNADEGGVHSGMGVLDSLSILD